MNADEIRKWHSVFKRDDELFEIRVLGDRTYSGYFYDVEQAIAQLAPYDNANIYYSLNEVKSACASREQFNCFKQVRGTATSEQDIEHRWWIPIDLDCERPSGVSSTDDEKAFAHKKAQDVYRFLRDNGFSNPVVCDSSSGYHLFYPIDMDNTPSTKETVKLFLETLSNQFTDDKVKIDIVLHDANRIIRLSGTFGRKGRSTQERPHRMAKILNVPETIVRMSQQQIDAFNEKYKVQETRQNTYQSQRNGDFDLRKFIATHGIEIEKEVKLSNGGTKFVLKECPFDSSHKAPDSAIFEMPSGAISFKCFHNSHARIGWKEFRLHYEPNAYDKQPQQPRQYQRYQQLAKPKYEIKKELPELGNKWLSMSDIKKVDLSQIESVKTGFNEVDDHIVGLHMSEVSILSGSNASGKSSWLNSLLLNIVQQNYKIALWSGELRADILKTWIQMVAAGKENLMPSKINIGKYYVPNNVGEMIDQWLDGKFFIYNNEYGTKWEQVFNDMTELLKVGVKVFALDNLFTLDIDLFDGDKNNKQKELILQIKDFAKRNQVHIILVAHPRKVMTFLRKNDISGTGDITNAADNVFIIHRVNEDFLHAIRDFFGNATASKFDSFGNVIAIEKNRMYGAADVMCGIIYEPESRRFMNYDNENVKYGWKQEMQQTHITYETPTNDVYDNEIDATFSQSNDVAPF